MRRYGLLRRAAAAGARLPDLGVGLPTLRHWIDRRREREIDVPPEERQEDMATELKRLRRENEILRQEREILKKATALFAKEGRRLGGQRSAPPGTGPGGPAPIPGDPVSREGPDPPFG
ncbi:hypothetical protein MicloDRAFT_00007630 [Microvirga lotononidis]|uniref:Transposase n=1 Tax=Microvirga lotononidis TaxID=864069 RepID=I4Z2S1_9HYPH|nr:hypothetical protein MicloDRAFT_00007630 [Microvirga lotononidis]